MLSNEAIHSTEYFSEWIGKVIDLPFHDLVIGVAPYTDTDKGITYNVDQGELLTKSIKSISKPTLIMISQHFNNPNKSKKYVLSTTDIGCIQTYISLMLIFPNKQLGDQFLFAEVPDPMLDPKSGIISRSPSDTIDLLFNRYKDSL